MVFTRAMQRPLPGYLVARKFMAKGVKRPADNSRTNSCSETLKGAVQGYQQINLSLPIFVNSHKSGQSKGKVQSGAFSLHWLPSFRSLFNSRFLKDQCFRNYPKHSERFGKFREYPIYFIILQRIWGQKYHITYKNYLK